MSSTNKRRGSKKAAKNNEIKDKLKKTFSLKSISGRIKNGLSISAGHSREPSADDSKTFSAETDVDTIRVLEFVGFAIQYDTEKFIRLIMSNSHPNLKNAFVEFLRKNGEWTVIYQFHMALELVHSASHSDKCVKNEEIWELGMKIINRLNRTGDALNRLVREAQKKKFASVIENASHLGEIQQDQYLQLSHVVLQLLSCSLSEFVASEPFFQFGASFLFESPKKLDSTICHVLANSKLEESPYFTKKSRSWLKLFTCLAECLPIPLVVCDMGDSEHPLVYGNPEFLTTWGFDGSDILGEGFSTLAGDETKLDIMEEISRKSSEKIPFSVESVWSRKDSTSIASKVLFLPIWTEHHIEEEDSGSDIEGDEEIAVDNTTNKKKGGTKSKNNSFDDDDVDQQPEEDFKKKKTDSEDENHTNGGTLALSLSAAASQFSEEAKKPSMNSPNSEAPTLGSQENSNYSPPIKYYIMLFIPTPTPPEGVSTVEAIQTTFFKLPVFAPTKGIWRINSSQ
eukprot:TRINITY_DN14580_c0_g1_i1.p1 TRINITY_DN14580_c0_g1~~TRINITY_DN14580_c0_g1_i1.p1  ORF type:complete len:511 (+),score=109.03 TRINITY_DN14580_c0_g1_i1:78-1610(+)